MTGVSRRWCSSYLLASINDPLHQTPIIERQEQCRVRVLTMLPEPLVRFQNCLFEVPFRKERNHLRA